jgi:hypothetical protein
MIEHQHLQCGKANDVVKPFASYDRTPTPSMFGGFLNRICLNKVMIEHQHLQCPRPFGFRGFRVFVMIEHQHLQCSKEAALRSEGGVVSPDTPTPSM